MGQVRRLRGRVLWIPAGAVAAVGALLAGTVLASAAAPNLPKKTAAQLLAAMSHASVPPALTAVISENANLGFPALPDIAGMPSSALSVGSWLAGSHTVQVWYSGPQHVRIAVPVPFGETDLRVNGSQVWLWQSRGQVATHIILPQPMGPAGPLWRFSHLRPAQIAHIPAFLQQRVPVGTGPVVLKPFDQGSRFAKVIRARISAGCPMPAWRMLGGPEGSWRIIKSSQLSGSGNKGWGWLNVNVAHAGQRLSRAIRIKQLIASSRIAAVSPSLSARVYASQFNAVPPDLAGGMLKAITPLQAARRLLAMIGPTTKVTVAGTTVVAGRPAYQLSIQPRSDQSLIGQILIAVDSQTYLPLQVQVIPRGSSSPAFQIGFTTFTPGQPAASNFTFTPPPGAHVHVVKLPNPMAGMVGPPGFAGPGGLGGAPSFWPVGVPSLPPGVHVHIRQVNGHIAKIIGSVPPGFACMRHLPALPSFPQPPPGMSPGPRVFGSGWLSVVEIPVGRALAGLSGGSKPTPGATVSPVPAPGDQAGMMLRLLLNSATQVHGSWGSGKLISTRLLNILITSKGQVLIGAVTPAVLYADAAQVK